MVFLYYAVIGLMGISVHGRHRGDFARIELLIFALTTMTGLHPLGKLPLELDEAFVTEKTTKEQIDSIIASHLPNFEHIETGKSLDGKM